MFKPSSDIEINKFMFTSVAHWWPQHVFPFELRYPQHQQQIHFNTEKYFQDLTCHTQSCWGKDSDTHQKLTSVNMNFSLLKFVYL